MTRPTIDIRRRTLLKWFMTGGLFMFAGGPRALRAMGSRPEAQGIHELEGDVRVNGKPARVGLTIQPGDVVETGPDSRVVFLAGDDVFLLRDNTRLAVSGGPESAKNGAIDYLKVANGKVLSVFGRGRKGIRTDTAVIGVRGTGLYIEARSTHTYVCACYGKVEMAALAAPDHRIQVSTRHHEQPRYIYAGGRERLIGPAPMMNHTDAELIFLESLAGRKPPFVGSSVKKYKGRSGGGGGY